MIDTNRRLYLKEIEESWGEGGFLASLRKGVFNRALYNNLYSAILKLNYEEYETIERETIRCLWFIPVCMYRQKEYIDSISSDLYDELREQIEEAIAGIFGYP